MKQKELLQEYKSYLILKNYRPQTIKSYVFIIDKFLQYCISKKQLNNTVQDYAKAYLINRFETGKSWSTVNMDYSAILILCKYILKVDWSYEFIPRPRTLKKLPQVLSQAQIEKMINGIQNLKHKTIFVLLYSTGIRLNELVNLDISDICMDRSQLHVRLGKGGKDRIVQIPAIGLEFIRAYLWTYNPKQFLFEGQGNAARYSASSIGKIVDKAAKRQGINKRVNTHCLRHTYATHHLSNGTDLISLQKQMGHRSIKTTIAYIHLCSSRMQHIKHPIENLKIDIPLKMESATF